MVTGQGLVITFKHVGDLHDVTDINVGQHLHQVYHVVWGSGFNVLKLSVGGSGFALTIGAISVHGTQAFEGDPIKVSRSRRGE